MAELTGEKKYTTYVPAMLAKIGEKVFDDPQWLFEVKWDGYRAVAEVNNQKVKLYSRKGLSFEKKYENVVAALETLHLHAVLDGEIVVIDPSGSPSFQLLQQYPEVPEGCILMYYVFDLLSYKGKELHQTPLLERKELLKELLPTDSIVRYCEHVVGEGQTFFKWVTEKGLEGMIAKEADSWYYPGKRTNQWLKIRNHTMQEVLIAGFTAPGGSRKYFGSLVLGIYEGKKLHYAGNVGTGFNDKSLSELYTLMSGLKREESPFVSRVDAGSDVTWVEPKLVCQVKYTEWTSDKHLRHPVFMGLRVDKQPEEVVLNEKEMTVTTVKNKKKPSTNGKDRAVQKEGEVKVGGHIVKLTNQDKVYFPDDHVTKGDVVNYYQEVFEYIIPYLEDRPQSLKRNPNGISDFGFFHKDAGDEAPEWVKSIPLYSDSAEKDIDYLLCNDRATLMYMNNLGCIEINPWNSRTAKLEYPDYMVIDIDPSDKNTFEQVIEVALVTKKVLDIAGAKAYCKTSGATGLHVYVPLGAQYSYDQCKEFAHIIASLVQEQLPFTTLERSLKKRGDDRIYIDYLQNRKGQTLSSVYSLRPKKGATVSTPLEWGEVKKGLKPTDFTIFTIFDRLKQKGDLFKEVLGKGIDLGECLKKLQGL